MNKLLFGFGVFIVIVVVAILFGPALVDWNSYKADLTEQVERLTGRKLTINGTIDISILPAPALVANDVHLSNIEGASANDMVSLKSLQIRLALGPLISGRIQVQTVHLVDPVFELERFSDGRTNMEFTPGPRGGNVDLAKGTDGIIPQTSQSPSGQSDGLSISLDNFVVENATVIYRDGKTGSIEKIVNLSATFAAASMEGPFESAGDLVARGIPLQYNISIGKIIEQRTAPVSLTIGLNPGQTKTTISGAIVGMDEIPTFKGLIKATGKNLSALIQSLGANQALPGMLGQTFAVEGEFEASPKAVEITNLSVSLGNSLAKGSAGLQLAETISATLDLGVESIDVDKWMAMPMIKKAVIAPPQSKQINTGSDQPNTTVSLEIPDRVRETITNQMTGGLLENVDATLHLKADSLTVNAGLVRHARLNAELSGGEITISQLTALLPGSADVALFGFILASDAQPGFEGNLEVSIGDLRGMMGWLGAPPPSVPSDRLRKLTLVASVIANDQSIALSDLNIQFDSSRLTGNGLVHLGKRLRIDSDLTLDRINLDAYLVAAKRAGPPPRPNIPAAPSSGQQGKAKQAAPVNQMAILSSLKDFDGNLKGRVQTLVYAGTQIKNVLVDGSLQNGALEVKNFSVDKIAGASLKASGQISNLDGIPQLKDIRFEAKAADIARLLRLAGVEFPFDSKKLGMLSLAAKIDGSVVNPQLDVNLKGAGSRVALAGKMSFLPIVGGFKGQLKVKHGDFIKMLRSLGVNYRPGGKIGGLDFESQIKADLSGLNFSDLDVKIGPVKINGTARISLGGPRLRYSADLKTNKIVTDLFLPVSRSASLVRAMRPVRAVFSPRPGLTGSMGNATFKRQDRIGIDRPHFMRAINSVNPLDIYENAQFFQVDPNHLDDWDQPGTALVAFAQARWPTDPIDVSALNKFDADLKVKSTVLVFGNYQLDNADLVASLEDGVLRIEKLNGGLFGGTIKATADVRATSPASIGAVVSVDKLDVAQGLMAMSGQSPATGTAAIKLNIKSSGFTVADMVAGLAGNGSIALDGLDVSNSGKGSAWSAPLGLISSLNNVGGLLSGQKSKPGLADISGNFRIKKGIVTSNDLTLVSVTGNGQAQGNVDLSRWLIDVAGQLKMAPNVLGLILNKGQGTPLMLPFSIKGDIDAPNVKIDISKLKGGGISLPGIGKLLNSKKLGGFLQQLIPKLGN